MGATTATPGMGNAFSCPWAVTSVGPTHPVAASGLAHLQIEQHNAIQLYLPKIYSRLCCLVGSASHPRPVPGAGIDRSHAPHPATLRDFAFLAIDLHAIVYVTLSFTLEMAYPFDPVTKVYTHPMTLLDSTWRHFR